MPILIAPRNARVTWRYGKLTLTASLLLQNQMQRSVSIAQGLGYRDMQASGVDLTVQCLRLMTPCKTPGPRVGPTTSTLQLRAAVHTLLTWLMDDVSCPAPLYD